MDIENPSLPGSPHFDLQTQVLGCLERGGIVVAANARAARALRQSFAMIQRAGGCEAWPTPAIHDWESWLSILWKQHLLNASDAPLMLSPLQERSVWQRIAGAQLGESTAIAVLAAGAWKLLSDFAAHEERRRSWSAIATADAEAFRGWASSFDKECRKKEWISRSDLPGLLVGSIQRATVTLPAEILLVGFGRFTPMQQGLIDAATKTGCVMNVAVTGDAERAPRLIRADDLRDELTTCAWWARRLLEEKPSTRIAVIIQDIDGSRGEIERIFRNVLMPESQGIERDEVMPFEFSLGKPLATVPVVKAALLLLRWLIAPLDQAAVSWLVISGFIAKGGNGSAEMARLDAEIRRYGELPPEIPLEALLSCNPRTQSQARDHFFGSLRSLQRLVSAEGIGRRARTFPEWIDLAGNALQQANWPGARTLDSTEFQALSRWERMLDDVDGLGFEGSRISYREFVRVLDRYATETIFSPESRDAPIQIMGAFESSGQTFDALWFVGVDDRQWPAVAQPHPLLPLSLQRKAAMPHASFDLDWQAAQEITHRIFASAPICFFSHAGRNDAGELRASPLLNEIFVRMPTWLTSAQLWTELDLPTQIAPICETVDAQDSADLPWPKDLRAGGSEILKRQSACAFQSFAARRLGADELAVAERGLTAIDRGDILHKVLEALWSKDNPPETKILGRDDLRNAQTSGRLASILSDHVDRAFNERRSSYRESEWTSAYLRVEKDRLKLLLSQWLDVEAMREPFTVVEHERKLITEISGLTLNLRVDRIDEVSGGQLILDYKTGRVSSAMWKGMRPEEPQLPLYGIYGGVENLRGVLFAQIRSGDLRVCGHVESATETFNGNLGRQSSLLRYPLNEDILGEWADALVNLADQFLAGDAAVAPKSYPKTCQHCALPSLCRVAETSVALDDDDEDDFVVEGSDDAPGGEGVAND